MKSEKHPLTLSLKKDNTPEGGLVIVDNQLNPIAKMVWYPEGLSEKTGNAIVRAVNVHDELLDALKTLHKESAVPSPAIDRLIAKAEGSQKNP